MLKHPILTFALLGGVWTPPPPPSRWWKIQRPSRARVNKVNVNGEEVHFQKRTLVENGPLLFIFRNKKSKTKNIFIRKQSCNSFLCYWQNLGRSLPLFPGSPLTRYSANPPQGAAAEGWWVLLAARQLPPPPLPSLTPDTWAEKFESFERINSIRETNGNFDSCNSCKRLGTSRLHELHESKFPFVSRIEFIRSKLSNFSAHVSGVTDCSPFQFGGDWEAGPGSTQS